MGYIATYSYTGKVAVLTIASTFDFRQGGEEGLRCSVRFFSISPSPSRPSVGLLFAYPFLLSPYSQPFPFPCRLSRPLITGRESRESYSSPSGSGQRPAAKRILNYLYNSQPKICKCVKVLPTCRTRPRNIFMTFPEFRFCPCCKLPQWVWAKSGYH